MSKIPIYQIKKLREQTNVPVMECKKALEKSGGDMKRAKVWLEKRDIVKVKKKKDRKAEEGIIHCYLHSGNRVGAMIKLCCESDFMACNEEFVKLAHEICMQIAAMKPKSIKGLLAQEYIRDPAKTIGDLLNEAIAQFGENIKIEAFSRFEI